MLCYFLHGWGFVFCFAFCSCHAPHLIASCASHLHTCSSHAFEHFLHCPFLHSGAPISSGGPFYLFSCAGVKRFQVGPRLVLRPWFTTVDRLSSFVPFGLRLILQRLTEGPKRPHVCCSPTPFQFGPKPPKPSPSSRAFDHDRVAENRTSFGLS